MSRAGDEGGVGASRPKGQSTPTALASRPATVMAREPSDPDTAEPWPRFALGAAVALRVETESVPAGTLGHVVGYYAAGREIEYAVSFERPDTLLRLPEDALEPVDRPA